MSLQTPLLVSTTYNSFTQTADSCSVVDANGNIYTSLKNSAGSGNYGGIQKTDTSGNVSIFLQLNATNAPGIGLQYPTGMCFNASGDILYYLVYSNNNIYEIIDLTNPNPIQVNLTDNLKPNGTFRIINSLSPNIFYISSTLSALNNDNINIYSIRTYNSTTQLYRVIFDLSSPIFYGSNYGIAQDPTGANLYIGLSAGQILKGEFITQTLTPFLILPQASRVIGLIFTAINTLFANTENGYGYKIFIDPDTNNLLSYELYYNTTTTTIIGGLGRNTFSTFLYGISSNQLWKIYTKKPTGYKFLYNSVQSDFADAFNTNSPGTVTTNYISAGYGNLDLGQIFTPGNSSVVTNYLYSTNIDLGSIFSVPNPWSALGSGFADEGTSEYAIAVDSLNNVYVGGWFTLVGGIYTQNIAKWDPALATWSSLGVGCGIYVQSIAIDSSDNVYVGGSFTSAGGIAANRIAKWDPVNSTWSALVDSLGGNGVSYGPSYSFVSSIAIDSLGNVYVGGQFDKAGGINTTYNIAKWTPSTSTWSSLGSPNGTNNQVLAIAIDSLDNVYIGGLFTLVGGINAYHIAKWDGSSWSALVVSSGGNGTTSTIRAIAIDSSNNVYVGGDFTSVGGNSSSIGPTGIVANHVAKWDPSNSTWYPLIDSLGGNGTNNIVYSMAIKNSNNIYIGGYFTSAGSISSTNHVAKWDPSNSTWSRLGTETANGVYGPGTTANISSIAIKSNNIYVTGYFTSAGSIITRNVAKYDSTYQ